MSAAIQLINPPLNQPGQVEAIGDQRGKIFSLELGTEQRMRQAFDYISRLQAEVTALKEQLRLAERSLGHKDQLLRNTLLRERALRSALISGEI
jgi:hypothetical protein